MKAPLSRFVNESGEGDGEGVPIGALAARTGVPVETLRIWERRYGVPSPMRSAGRHRRYGERDVERVRWLAARVADGRRIGEAVGALRFLDPGAGPPLHESLVEAAVDGDQPAVERQVDAALEALDLVDALEDVVFPALAELGGRWERDLPVIAAEHLLSEVVAARLAGRMAAARRRTGPQAVVYCPGGERHALGAMALCIVLSEAGWRVTFLGADLPTPEAAAMAARLGARLVVAVCTLPRGDALAGAEVPPGDAVWAVAGPGAVAPAAGTAPSVVLGPRLRDVRAQAGDLLRAWPTAVPSPGRAPRPGSR